MRKSLALAVIGACSFGCEIGLADDYKLGAQDHLRVKVYDYRSATGDAHEWAALVGEFVVNPAGKVSFPIVGELPAAGQSTSQLAQALAVRLQEKVGLAQAPQASVEVMQFRPFYIIGLVDKPGEYAYRPGLSVLQAVGIAGGFQKTQDIGLMSLQKDELALRGEADGLTAEKARLEVKLERLEQQIAQKDTFAPRADAADTSAVAQAKSEEARLFRDARDTRIEQRAGIEKTKAFLEREIGTLTEKGETVERQIALVKREGATVNGLVERGLAVASRGTTIEETEAQLESSRLDIRLAISHAQQDILRADRDLADLSEKARAQTLNDAAEVRSRLDAITVKLASTNALVRQAQLAAVLSADVQTLPKVRFSIARVGEAGSAGEFMAQETDVVLPGDTVKVERELPASADKSVLSSIVGLAGR